MKFRYKSDIQQQTNYMPITITVFAKPSAKENRVEKISETEFRVSVKEPPVQGRANTAIIGLLAKYFNVVRAQVKIIHGYTSREKIITIQN